MLGKLHYKYLALSRDGTDWKSKPAPYGRCFGVPIASLVDKYDLELEEPLQTAEDLGYE